MNKDIGPKAGGSDPGQGARRRPARPPAARPESPLAAAARRMAEEAAQQRDAPKPTRPTAPTPRTRTAAATPAATRPAADASAVTVDVPAPPADAPDNPAASTWWATAAPQSPPQAPATDYGQAPPQGPAGQHGQYPPPPVATNPYGQQPEYGQYPPPPAPGSQPTGPFSPVYSPWWKRALALLLDIVVIGVPSGLIFALFADPIASTNPITGDVTFDLTASYVVCWLLTTIVTFGYYVILEGGAGGATVGKMALGIQVRDATNLGPLGYGKAFARRIVGALLWWLLIIPGLLDVLSPLWDNRRQSWHDKAAGSVVVDKL